MKVDITGSLVAAGKATATTSDQTIAVTFNNISIINDGPNELRLSIDDSSLTSNKIIYVAIGETFDKGLAGSSLHHSVASGSAVFRYVLG